MNTRKLTCFVSVVISYSSNEKGCYNTLSQSFIFSDDIVVSYGSHLLDGSAEIEGHIAELGQRFPNVCFAKFQVDLSLNLSEQAGVHDRPKAYWHNLARWTGVTNLKRKQWVLVLDADEVPEGRLVQDWLLIVYPTFSDATCYKIATFWYFKSPIHQATTLEDSPLLVHYKHLTKANIFGDWEREHIISHSQCSLQNAVKGDQGQVLWHHFSWVRSKSAMTQKMQHWGHADDRFKVVNVERLLEDVFRDDNANDFVHHYKYRKVSNTFGIQV